MNGAARQMVYDAGGMARKSIPGDTIENPQVDTVTTDANATLTVALLLKKIYHRSGTNTSRTDTTDTAANIIAALPNLNIGDSFACLYANASTANVITIGAGTGITLVGLATIGAGVSRLLVFKKTSATAMNCYIC